MRKNREEDILRPRQMEASDCSSNTRHLPMIQACAALHYFRLPCSHVVSGPYIYTRTARMLTLLFRCRACGRAVCCDVGPVAHASLSTSSLAVTRMHVFICTFCML